MRSNPCDNGLCAGTLDLRRSSRPVRVPGRICFWLDEDSSDEKRWTPVDSAKSSPGAASSQCCWQPVPEPSLHCNTQERFLVLLCRMQGECLFLHCLLLFFCSFTLSWFLFFLGWFLFFLGNAWTGSGCRRSSRYGHGPSTGSGRLWPRTAPWSVLSEMQPGILFAVLPRTRGSASSCRRSERNRRSRPLRRMGGCWAVHSRSTPSARRRTGKSELSSTAMPAVLLKFDSCLFRLINRYFAASSFRWRRCLSAEEEGGASAAECWGRRACLCGKRLPPSNRFAVSLLFATV